jgi:hypothetical protein
MSEVQNPLEATVAPEVSTIDSTMLRMATQRMRDQQNLSAGIVAGTAAAVVGAGLWALTTVVTGYQIGWVAVGVGFLVGYAIRIVGKGVDQSFAVAGAALALFGCVLGNLLTVCYFVAENEGIAVLDLLPQLDVAIVSELLVATFAPMDLLFYGIAVYEGFHLSTVSVTENDLQAVTAGPVIS